MKKIYNKQPKTNIILPPTFELYGIVDISQQTFSAFCTFQHNTYLILFK
jgi:hypothetical protein